ncbi:MAG: type II secretion system F family protein [Isosphaeraceae bacterium]
MNRESDPETFWSGDDSSVAGTGGEDQPTAASAPTRPASPPSPGPAARKIDRDLPTAGGGTPWRLSHMMLLIVAVAIACWMGVTLGLLLIVIGVVAAFGALVTAGFVAARLRLTRQDALLAILGIAAEHNMPLGPAVSAVADQFGGLSRRRVANLGAQLELGAPLPDALERPRRVVSRDALLLVRVGHQSGLLARALRLTGVARANQLASWSAFATRATYLLAVLLAAEFVLSFLALSQRRIPNQIQAICNDFRVRLPSISVETLRLLTLIQDNASIVALVMLAELAALIYVPLSFGGWMNYRVPLFDRLLPRRHAALVLRTLSLPIEAGQPIASALVVMAERYPARWIRRRLAKAALAVIRGADWIDSLWKTGVIGKAEAEVLASAASVGNLAWACRELADTAERRQQLRIQVLTQGLFPFVILTVGLVVAFLCFGLFLPLVTIMQALVEW